MIRLIVFLILTLSLNSAFAAKILKFKGKVLVNSVRQSQAVSINTGDVVEAVGKDSFFIIGYEDGSKFILRNGKIKVESINPKKKTSTLNMVRGLMSTFINPKSNNKFIVKNKSTIFGVRGKKFMLNVTEKDSYLCVCEGKVEVSKNGESALVSRGEDITVEDSTKELKTSKAIDQMWTMASGSFVDLGITIKDRK